ncbi:ABC transporter permease [Gynuella sunshinyii]|uniref:ABC-type spermidine/putrescine transport system, permease component II n=1 Tax=Gynuella sunshinyii YC6258 TaxID=1445510 RepID=A0A0C5UZL7_9GAMM|nr:ABC transporter permease subunit [Gynuella sunshinyii]AJQ92735.1 ABC-type spermidine/putrescine transport system, permease component II [Gynuella sunshinyii YC6258]
MKKRSSGFFILAGFFMLFVLFLYGPTITIAILSFQGPGGGLTFPMQGTSLHWFRQLFAKQAVGDFGAALVRSLMLGTMVMITTLVFSLLAGMAFRKRFTGSSVIFYLALASLIIPSILISLGIGLMFDRMDLTPQWFSSGFGSHLTWTLPFGLLIMFAVFNRFNPAYEMASADLGASDWQTFRFILLPLLAPSLLGVALFGFTLSYDEFARTLMTSGSFNTLPLELFAMTTNVTTPVLYALGTLTTLVSLACILITIILVRLLRRSLTKTA